jgi:DNA-binding transcriptional LysR family regulator
MTTNLPDLDAVRVFAAIVETGSFKAAAERLGQPRSTVSWRLAALEDALGVRLLVRTTRKVNVTDAGRDYFEQVRAALQIVDDANRRVRGLTEAPRGPVRIAASPGFGATWMTAIAERLLTRHPAVELVVDLQDRFVDLVGEGFDAAIRGGELPDSSLTARTLQTARTYCYASPAWLEGRPPIHTPRDLAAHDVILYAGGPRGEWVFEGPPRTTVAVRGRYTVNSHRLHVEAAERGLGVARVFPFLVGPALAAGRLVPVLPGWGSPETKLHVVTLGATRRTAALDAFLEVLAEVVLDGGPGLSRR